MASGRKRTGRPKGSKDKVKRKSRKQSPPIPPSLATYYSKSTNAESNDPISSEQDSQSQQSCNISANSDEEEWVPVYEGIMEDEDCQHNEHTQNVAQQNNETRPNAPRDEVDAAEANSDV